MPAIVKSATFNPLLKIARITETCKDNFVPFISISSLLFKKEEKLKLNNEKIRILGKGITALALKDKFPNATLYDDSDFNEYDLNSNEYTVVSPGIPPYNNMILSSKNLISDYDLFASVMPFSVWISGTNGKTTTTQMCQHLLKDYGYNVILIEIQKKENKRLYKINA